jgi:hypothetical protein
MCNKNVNEELAVAGIARGLAGELCQFCENCRGSVRKAINLYYAAADDEQLCHSCPRRLSCRPLR